MMKKRLIRNVVIAVVGILLLVGLYVLVLSWDPVSDDTESEETNSEITYVVSEKADDISHLHIKNEFGEYDILRAVDENGNSVYTIPQITTGDMDESKIRSAVSKFGKIIAERKIDGDNLKKSDYGIDDKSPKVTIVKTDGTEIGVCFGSQTPDGFQYYCMKDGQNPIYTVSSVIYEAVTLSRDNYRVDEILNIADVSHVDRVKIYKNGNCVLSIRTATESENLGKAVAAGWMMEHPWKLELANDKTSEMLQSIAVVNATGFPEDVGAEEFEYRVEINTDDAYYSYDVSEKDKNGNVCLKNNLTDNVYYVGEELLNNLNSINPNDYISKFVCLYNISSVTKVEIDLDEEKYVMEVGNDEMPYKIRGNEVAKKEFTDVYQKIIGLSFVEICEDNPRGDLYMKISFDFAGSSGDVIEFYPIDERYYMAVSSNGLSVKVLKSEVDTITNIVHGQL